MNEKYIAVFDSGIGGLTVLEELSSRMPYKNFIYISDSKNTPYGSLSTSTLLRLTLKSLSILNSYNIEGLVLGCNTISVSLREKLQQHFNFPVFGVFPPVESCLMKNQRILLVATPKTISCFPEDKNLYKVGLPNLAKQIEDNALNLDKIDLLKHIPNHLIKNNAFDRVILGCTHYVLIKNKFFDHFCPQKVISGNHFTVNFVSKFYQGTKSLEKTYGNCVLFLGENAYKNQEVYYKVVKKH